METENPTPVSPTDPEAARLADLAAYRILDTPPEAEFDALTQLAAQLCGWPTALITLLDEHRQWFKSRVNMAVAETPRQQAFCRFTIQDDEPFQVEDAAADERFADNPLVTGSPGIRAYCGVPLTTPQGQRLGSLCVIDYRPSRLSDQQLQALGTLAQVVMTRLELRRGQFRLAAEQERVALANAELALSNQRLQASLEEYNAVNEQLQRANEDIRQLMHRQRRHSERQFEELMESITELFFAVDGQLTCLYWNRACEQFTGQPAGQVVGKSLHRVFPQLAGGRTEATLKGVLTSGVPVKYEYAYGERCFKVRMFPSSLGVSVLVIDITENKAREAELRTLNQQLTERNFELDQIVYKISHDIRSPLTSVLGLLHVLELQPLTQQGQQYVSLMENRIHKLDRFTRAMLDFSRTSRTPLRGEVIDFDRLVEECVQELAYLPGCDKLKISLRWQGEPVCSDLFRMRIIFQNLMANAIKYQHPQRKRSRLTITVLSQGPQVLIAFRDNGLGIAAEHQPRIFEMFYRASQQSEGSGLGTYIVKQTVEKLGGRVSLTSRPGVGTRIELRLPTGGRQPAEQQAGEMVAGANRSSADEVGWSSRFE